MEGQPRSPAGSGAGRLGVPPGALPGGSRGRWDVSPAGAPRGGAGRAAEAPPAAEAPAEQRVYAAVLQAGTALATSLLLVGFALYLGGVLPAFTPVESLPGLWHLKVQTFVERTGAPTGWGWVRHVARGDYFNYLGIGLLAGLTIVGYVVLLAAFLRRREWIYSALVALEVAVLLLAASGVLRGEG